MKLIKNDSDCRPISFDDEATIVLTGAEIALIVDALPLLRDKCVRRCFKTPDEDKYASLLKEAYEASILHKEFEDFFETPF